MTLKQIYIFIILSLGLIPISVQATTLSTEFKSSPSYLVGSAAGNMFDVNVLGGNLLVTGMDIHTSLAPGSSNSGGTVNVYKRSGSYAGHELSSSGWSLVDSVAFTSAGLGNATFIDIADFVLTGGITGLYVTLLGVENTRMRYTVGNVGTTGNVAAANSDLDIRVGIGLTQPDFSGSASNITYSRIWNGSIHYEPAQVPEPSTLMLLGLGLLGVNLRRRLT